MIVALPDDARSDHLSKLSADDLASLIRVCEHGLNGGASSELDRSEHHGPQRLAELPRGFDGFPNNCWGLPLLAPAPRASRPVEGRERARMQLEDFRSRQERQERQQARRFFTYAGRENPLQRARIIVAKISR